MRSSGSIRTALLRRLASAGLAALLVNLAVPSGFVMAADEPKTYIVVFRPGVASGAKTDDVERRNGFVSDFRYASALQGFAARLSSVQLARLRADPDIAFVSADRVLHAIGTVPIKAGDTAPPGVRRIGAATTTTVREASTANVAVIDSGVDLTHPDLNAVNGKNCIGSGTARDDNGHGTHVAGTIAAKNNGSGVTGVAPGTKIYAVKVINAQGSGTDAQVICGIDWVTANAAALGIKVANMSLGGPGTDDGNCGNTIGDALHRAICNSVAAGVTYVVAAGNSSEDFAADVPANYNEALTVTAMADFDGLPGGGGSPSCNDGYFEQDDSAAGFSNFTTVGSSDAAHTIAAPGVCIQSTWPGNRYQTISGTSMASPHMAGVVALCFGEKGATGPCTGLTPAQVIAKMRANAAGHAQSDPASGFVGDPDHSIGAYYGYLAWAGAVDTTAPVISSVNATGITHEAAKITWTTDENADSQVEYGTTAAYGSTTPVTSKFETSHAVGLSGLSPTTLYHYRVKSRDGWGNLAVSGDFTFTTTVPMSDLALTGSVSPEPANVGDT
ncbi:MAG: S8 family serine peptidase, partial [Chloroflexota bacterium]